MSEQPTTVAADGGAVEYRDVPGFPGYRVGDDGSVWSCLKLIILGGRSGSRSEIGDTWKRLRVTINPDGYPLVTLRRDGLSHNRSVHSIVMLTFVGPIPDGEEVAHENGIRADPRLSNLSYKTYRENQRDSYRHGTRPLGERHPNAKATEEAVRSIRADHASRLYTITDIARRHRLSRTQTRDIISRKSWAHV
jgi:hypothetical protein